MTAKCESCGKDFTPPDGLQDRFPGWTPKECTRCWRAPKGGARSSAGGQSRSRSLVEENLTVAEVLDRYTLGPTDGVFTDGSATPNPGPGGWGAVYVVDNQVVDRAHGADPDTTNNRMELTAIAEAFGLVPDGRVTTIYTDSKLAVDTLTNWAYGWEKKGWKRKGGPIANLDLVEPLFSLVRSRPEVTLEWIKAHSGNRWNEYADSLSTAYLRSMV